MKADLKVDWLVAMRAALWADLWDWSVVKWVVQMVKLKAVARAAKKDDWSAVVMVDMMVVQMVVEKAYMTAATKAAWRDESMAG